ncbi:MAG: Rab family GTPase [Promethearchaeota archaeon]
MEEDLRFKLCIFGDGGVGKTSMTRYYNREYKSYAPNLGFCWRGSL